MAGLTLQAPAPLEPRHEIAQFDSGVAALDEWLKRRARANHAAGASRVYVVADAEERIVGYYAIASGALAVAEAPSRLKRNMPDPIPMAILGRLAIDRSHQGRGLGVAVLQDAVLRIQSAAAIIGVRGVLVHAISPQAQRFYARHGFVSGPKQPQTLILSLAQDASPRAP